MRPPEELLNRFYDLAEFDDSKRHQAVVAILEASHTNGEYCMDRLICGLASTRAAARLGFSCALTLILSSQPEKWTTDQLFKLIDEKLDISKADNSHSMIGQHLAYTAMINSDAFSSAAFDLVSRELVLFRKHNFLTMAVCDSIARLALQLDVAKFSKLIWPQIKSFLTEPLQKLLPEWMYFALLIAPKFAKVMEKKVVFMDEKGGLSLSSIEKEELINLLKRAHGNNAVSIGMKLLSVARGCGNFSEVYEQVIEPWLRHGDMQKALERTLRFVNEFLSEEQINSGEVLIIFSPSLIQTLLSVRKTKENRYATPLAELVLEKIIESINKGDWTRKGLLSLLDRLSSVGGGNFDELFHTNFAITEKALAKLDGKGVEKFIVQALTTQKWTLRYIVKVFASWTVDLQGKVLAKLVQQQPRSEDTHYAFCDCIASLFTTNVRAGKSVKTAFPEVGEKMLQGVLLSFCDADKVPKCNDRILSVFALVVRLWSESASDQQEKLEYAKDIEEIIAIDENLSSTGTEVDYSVLLDLLLSVISRSRRFHRSIVHFVFATLLPNFKIGNIKHIIESINTPDDELMKSKEDDESDSGEEMDTENFAGIDDEELEEDAEETSGEEDLDGEVDPILAQNLKRLLDSTDTSGEGHDEEKESVSSDLSDDAMFRLDEGLAAVFRQRTRQLHRVDTAAIEQTQQFRLKCFDFLLIVASHEDSKKLAVEMLFPLLDTAREALRRKNGAAVFEKSKNLIEIIIRHRKGVIKEKKALKLFDEMVLASSQIVNPILKSEVGKIASFLFSTTSKQQEVGKTQKLVQKVEELLELYMSQDNNRIIWEVVFGPCQNYPQILVPLLEKLIAFAFNDDIRIYRRVKENSSEEKEFWKRVAGSLGTYVHSYISKVTSEELKPRFLAFVIRLLSSFVSLTSDSNKKLLVDSLSEDLDFLTKQIDNWKISGKKKQQLNINFQKICGRNILAALKQIQKYLTKNEKL